jgi:hypothetical protein
MFAGPPAINIQFEIHYLKFTKSKMRSFMINCNQIKRLIDEAEQPELLSFEATHHLNACTPCRLFAEERAGLRALLNGIPRVNAPINFDAQLKARMTTAKAKPTVAWLNPALYMRFGAASAVLLVAVFVAQYNGLFTLTDNEASIEKTPPPELTSNLVQPAPSKPDASRQKDVGPIDPPPAVSPSMATAGVTISSRGGRRVQPGAVRLEGVRLEAEAAASRVPGLILRDSGREVELPMLPVSVGAQQKLINRSGRSTVQPIAISF